LTIAPGSRPDRIAAAMAVLCAVVSVRAEARPARGTDADVLVSRRARADFALTADPRAAAWKGVRGVFAERDRRGAIVPGHRTEIRSRWTEDSLYLLFICPYEELYLKPDPATAADTSKLWDWDVAEAFIGTDFQDITKYKEFQVSPQGEWVDLAIDRGAHPPRHDEAWNSGYEVKARVDRGRRIWYGEMRIPMAALGLAHPGPVVMAARINLFRCQGPPARRKYINWRTVNGESFHTPEAFGRLRLER
jgi:cellulose/xylan binding protein with CBM9 domain